MEFREINLSETEEVFALLEEASSGENGFSTGNVTKETFGEYLQGRVEESLGKNLPQGRVPQTTYIYYFEGKAVGILKFRRELNEALLLQGGNVGYYIKKSMRGNGFGSKMLESFIEKVAKKTNLEKLLITCNEDNLLSEKVILSSGGNLENIIDGKKRFWIKL